MPKPANPVEFPKPQSGWSGNRFNISPKVALATIAKLWRPSGTTAMADAATLALVALRVVDRTTGSPYSADELLTNPTLVNPVLQSPIESTVVIGNTGTAQTISLVNGTVLYATLTGNCTFTMPIPSFGKSFTLILATGTGSFTSSFPTVNWPGGTPPTITAASGKVDILKFTSNPAGTAWYGTFTQNYTP